MSVDFDYLSRRYEDELKLANEADSQAARDAHLALAHQYLAELERMRSEDGPELRLATS